MTQNQKFFDLMKSNWEKETFLLSNSSDIYKNENYQSIIKMGVIAIPMILKDWESTNNHWFYALNEILQVDPIKECNRGNIKAMKQDWIDYLINI